MARAALGLPARPLGAVGSTMTEAWTWAADHVAIGAKVRHDRAGGDCAADGTGGERLAGGGEDDGAGLEAAVGEQDVGRDHHRRRFGGLRDPVVGGVEGVGHDDPLDQRMIGDADPLVADDRYRDGAAESNLVDFLLYRAGIGVDEDAGHGRSLVTPA